MLHPPPAKVKGQMAEVSGGWLADIDRIAVNFGRESLRLLSSGLIGHHPTEAA